MSGSLLTTKLNIPIARPDLVARPGLLRELEAGEWRPFTLVSAPAGFGKTTLVSEWIRQSGRPVAWVSLDALDNDPARFVSYVTAALRKIDIDLGGQALEAPLGSSPFSLNEVLTDLINQVDAIPDDFMLVLDDYHVITNMEIQEFMASLLDSIPPKMHLVFNTRVDPSLPLSRLRARGLLTEVRESDLRFTRDEASEFIKSIMGIDLTADEIDVLEERTEGWVAGLQLAALSMRGSDDVSGFVRAFAGDDRHIIDFLAEEVFDRQPKDIQKFLLQTAVLGRFTGALCDAVSDGDNGSEMLKRLEQANLFVVPLDDKRLWYRYHQLFADMLRARLMQDQPDWEQIAHHRASEWHEADGTIDEAITHAVSAKELERAADLIEGLVETFVLGSQREFMEKELSGLVVLLDRLPDSVVRARPQLSIVLAFWFGYMGLIDAAESRLIEVEAQLNALPENADPRQFATEIRVLNGVERTQANLGLIAAVRSYIAQTKGDTERVFKHSHEALSLLPDTSVLRFIIATSVGRAYWMRGDVTNAGLNLDELRQSTAVAGLHSAHLAATAYLGRIRVVQGRLKDAMDTYEQSIEVVTEPEAQISSGYVDVHVGIGDVLREWNRLEEAEKFIDKGTKHTERFKSLATQYSPNFPLHALAQLKRSQGDIGAALQAIEKAEQLPITEGVSAHITPPAAFKTRLWLVAGQLEQAGQWAKESGLGVDDDLDYVHEYEHITFARVLIAQHIAIDSSQEPLSGVVKLLDRLLQAAEHDERNGSVIEILLVQAMAHQAMGSKTGSETSFERALALAEPEGYARIFLDEGEAVLALLRDSVARGGASGYARDLLEAFGEIGANPGASVDSQNMTGLVEPLSTREIEIVRLITTGMTNQEIADHLFIALATVKSHTTHIYAKLGVDRRSQAIARVQELGLL